MSKNLSTKKLLIYLTEYLILALNELSELKDLSDFDCGEYWAFIECLEILSKWHGFKNFRIDNIEQHFAGAR